MHHQEQMVPTQKQKNGPRKKKKFLSKLTMLVGAVLLVVGVGYGLTTLFPPVTARTRDHISPAQAQQNAREFSKLQSIDLKKVQLTDRDNALDSMNLPFKQRKALFQNLNAQNNSVRLVWLSLWDFAAEDGDVVNVSSAGYMVEIPLFNKITTIAIPVDSSRQIIIQGNIDGGGGITLGVKNGNSPVQLPVIRPGEAITLTASISAEL